MTHKLTLTTNVRLAWFNPSHSGSPAAGDYLTLTVGATNDLGITGSGSETLTFPPGTYALKASIGGNKTTASDNITYQWEIGGTLSGNLGGWDSSTNRKMSCECAEFVFTSSTSSTLKLKCVSVSGASNTLVANASCVTVRGVS